MPFAIPPIMLYQNAHKIANTKNNIIIQIEVENRHIAQKFQGTSMSKCVRRYNGAENGIKNRTSTSNTDSLIEWKSSVNSYSSIKLNYFKAIKNQLERSKSFAKPLSVSNRAINKKKTLKVEVAEKKQKRDEENAKEAKNGQNHL